MFDPIWPFHASGHRQAVLAAINGNTQLQADVPQSARGIVEPSSLAMQLSGQHPVRRALDIGELGDAGARHVEQHLGDRQARHRSGRE